MWVTLRHFVEDDGAERDRVRQRLDGVTVTLSGSGSDRVTVTDSGQRGCMLISRAWLYRVLSMTLSICLGNASVTIAKVGEKCEWPDSHVK